MKQESLPQLDNFEDSARVLREQAESLGAKSVGALEKRRSDEFEELVRAALEKELKYERDPNLKDIAAKRADQIIAAYQSGLALNPHRAEPEDTPPDYNVAVPNTKQDGGEPQSNLPQALPKSPRPAPVGRPVYPATTSFSLADIIMGSVILLLVIIIILLLV